MAQASRPSEDLNIIVIVDDIPFGYVHSTSKSLSP